MRDEAVQHCCVSERTADAEGSLPFHVDVYAQCTMCDVCLQPQIHVVIM